jgi:hypothetical protein
MKVLILGEYRAERIVSAVRKHVPADIVICGRRDVSRQVGGRVRHRDLPRSAGRSEIMSLLHAEAPDLVLPNVYPKGQEQMLPIYAEVATDWRAAGGNMPVHSPAFAELACDKAVFQATGTHRGWPVPEGTVCPDAAALDAAAASLGFPVMVKQARSEPTDGRFLVPSRHALRAVRPALRYPVVAQRAYRGEEFGAEFLTMAGTTLRWPVARLGTVPSAGGPGRRIRVMPRRLPPAAFRVLQEFVADVTAAYRVLGSWQLDLILAEDGLHVVEINARLGGLSAMSHLATAVDPHQAFVAACLGDVGTRPRPRFVSMELPIASDGRPPAPPPGVRHELDGGSPTDRFLLSAGYRRLRLRATPGSDVPAWLAEARHLLRVPLADVQTEFARARETVLSAGTAPAEVPGDP